MFDRMVHERPYSDDTAKEIDEEVQGLIREAAKRAEIIIRANLKPLDTLAKALLKEETIEGDEVKKLLSDAKLPKDAALY